MSPRFPQSFLYASQGGELGQFSHAHILGGEGTDDSEPQKKTVVFLMENFDNDTFPCLIRLAKALHEEGFPILFASETLLGRDAASYRFHSLAQVAPEAITSPEDTSHREATEVTQQVITQTVLRDADGNLMSILPMHPPGENPTELPDHTLKHFILRPNKISREALGKRLLKKPYKINSKYYVTVGNAGSVKDAEYFVELLRALEPDTGLITQNQLETLENSSNLTIMNQLSTAAIAMVTGEAEDRDLIVDDELYSKKMQRRIPGLATYLDYKLSPKNDLSISSLLKFLPEYLLRCFESTLNSPSKNCEEIYDALCCADSHGILDEVLEEFSSKDLDASTLPDTKRFMLRMIDADSYIVHCFDAYAAGISTLESTIMEEFANPWRMSRKFIGERELEIRIKETIKEFFFIPHDPSRLEVIELFFSEFYQKTGLSDCLICHIGTSLAIRIMQITKHKGLLENINTFKEKIREVRQNLLNHIPTNTAQDTRQISNHNKIKTRQIETYIDKLDHIITNYGEDQDSLWDTAPPANTLCVALGESVDDLSTETHSEVSQATFYQVPIFSNKQQDEPIPEGYNACIRMSITQTYHWDGEQFTRETIDKSKLREKFSTGDESSTHMCLRVDCRQLTPNRVGENLYVLPFNHSELEVISCRDQYCKVLQGPEGQIYIESSDLSKCQLTIGIPLSAKAESNTVIDVNNFEQRKDELPENIRTLLSDYFTKTPDDLSTLNATTLGYQGCNLKKIACHYRARDLCHHLNQQGIDCRLAGNTTHRFLLLNTQPNLRIDLGGTQANLVYQAAQTQQQVDSMLLELPITSSTLAMAQHTLSQFEIALKKLKRQFTKAFSSKAATSHPTLSPETFNQPGFHGVMGDPLENLTALNAHRPDGENWPYYRSIKEYFSASDRPQHGTVIINLMPLHILDEGEHDRLRTQLHNLLDEGAGEVSFIFLTGEQAINDRSVATRMTLHQGIAEIAEQIGSEAKPAEPESTAINDTAISPTPEALNACLATALTSHAGNMSVKVLKATTADDAAWKKLKKQLQEINSGRTFYHQGTRYELPDNVQITLNPVDVNLDQYANVLQSNALAVLDTPILLNPFHCTWLMHCIEIANMKDAHFDCHLIQNMSDYQWQHLMALAQQRNITLHITTESEDIVPQAYKRHIHPHYVVENSNSVEFHDDPINAANQRLQNEGRNTVLVSPSALTDARDLIYSDPPRGLVKLLLEGKHVILAAPTHLDNFGDIQQQLGPLLLGKCLTEHGQHLELPGKLTIITQTDDQLSRELLDWTSPATVSSESTFVPQEKLDTPVINYFTEPGEQKLLAHYRAAANSHVGLEQFKEWLADSDPNSTLILTSDELRLCKNNPFACKSNRPGHYGIYIDGDYFELPHNKNNICVFGISGEEAPEFTDESIVMTSHVETYHTLNIGTIETDGLSPQQRAQQNLPDEVASQTPDLNQQRFSLPECATEQRKAGIEQLWRHLQTVSQGSNAQAGIMLEGPSSIGKSTLLQIMLEQQGYQVIKLTHENQLVSNNPKVAYICQSPNVIEAATRHAKAHHQVVVADELNSLPLKQQLKIQQILLDEQPASGFCFAATMNPGYYQGREPILASLMGLCHHIKFAAYNAQELKAIATRRLKQMTFTSSDGQTVSGSSLPEEILKTLLKPVTTSKNSDAAIRKLLQLSKTLSPQIAEVYCQWLQQEAAQLAREEATLSSKEQAIEPLSSPATTGGTCAHFQGAGESKSGLSPSPPGQRH